MFYENSVAFLTEKLFSAFKSDEYKPYRNDFLMLDSIIFYNYFSCWT